MVNDRTTWTPSQLRELRETLGLTQREAAEKIGVSRRTWEGWEIGARRPTSAACVLIQLLKSNQKFSIAS